MKIGSESKTMPPSDSEAVKMHQLIGQSLNIQTGRSFEKITTGSASWSVKLIHFSSSSSKFVRLAHLTGPSSMFF